MVQIFPQEVRRVHFKRQGYVRGLQDKQRTLIALIASKLDKQQPVLV